MSLQLHIPTPCTENWDAMTPEEQGRFCSHCQKTVIDFSQMTDNDIIYFLEKHKAERICGRFQNTQLNRDINVVNYSKSVSYRESAIFISSILAATSLAAQSDSLPKIDTTFVTSENTATAVQDTAISNTTKKTENKQDKTVFKTMELESCTLGLFKYEDSSITPDLSLTDVNSMPENAENVNSMPENTEKKWFNNPNVLTIIVLGMLSAFLLFFKKNKPQS